MTETTAAPEAAEVESPSTEEATEVTESPSEQEVEAKADDEGSTPAEKAEEEAEPKEWANLLKKFDGNKDLAGKAFWRAVNDNSAMAKENKELKAYREAAEKAKTAKPAETPVAIKEIDTFITAQTTVLEKTLPAQEMKLFESYRSHEKEITRLEFELERADEVDKRTIKAELRGAQADLKATERDIREVQAKAKNTEYEINRARAYRKEVETKLVDQERAKQEQEGRVAAFMESFPDEINSYVEKHAPAFNLEADEELRDTVYEFLMGYAAHYRGTEEDADKDWEGLVKVKLEREAKRIDKAGRAHYAKVSKEIKKTAAPAKTSASSPGNGKTPQMDDGLTPGMREARRKLASRNL